MILSEILIPLLNANEPEARLVGIHVSDGQQVKKGGILFTIETTKATADIEAPVAGFVHLLVKEGETLSVGYKMAVLTETSDEPVEILQNKDRDTQAKDIHPQELRITKPARILAQSLGLNLATLPSDKLVTEEIIRSLVSKKEMLDIDFPNKDKPYILIFGAGGHAKSVMEILIQQNKYNLAGILDDNANLIGSKVLGTQVIGTRAILPNLLEKGISEVANCVGGIVDINVRVRIYELLKDAGFTFPEIIHSRACVEQSANVREGVQVFANAYIGSEAVLEAKCIVNTNAVVSHDCIVGAYAHIAPGALLAGHVQVGEQTLIGMGVTTAIGVKIGSRVRIGNGAIILADVPDQMVIQAGRFWVGKAE
jgi:sugar O-acyltransferase (sialic acid O-acetyltransferase NeuD family)